MTEFHSRIKALGFSPRTFALTIGVSQDTVRAWCGLRKSTLPSEWAWRLLELFENNELALEDYRRWYPVEVKPRGRPFQKGNTIGKRFP